MQDTADNLMERASQALAKTDYLSCERGCLAALSAARKSGDWALYTRVLLPLQEARRQRRMIAADGHVRLGTSDMEGPGGDWSTSLEAGCIVVTRPFTAEHAAGLAAAVDQQRKCVEVLFADSEMDAERWTIRSYAGPAVTVERACPPVVWVDRWLEPGEVAESGEPGPDDWFIDATEALGDAALAQVTAELGSVERVEQLEQMLSVVTDHEILHQSLGEAARAVLRGSGSD